MSGPQKKRSIVYIDGFNLYYSVLRYFPAYKWLDLQSYFESLRPDDDIQKIKFFTAIVEPKRVTSPTRDRQKRYLKALEGSPKVEVFLGAYQTRTVTCRATCKEEYQTAEEKQTDTNIVVNIMDDVIKDNVDTIILVSGDSDIQPAIKWVKDNYPKMKITVLIPATKEEESKRRNDFYPRIRVNCRFFPLEQLNKFLLPNPVVLPNGNNIRRPVEWR